MSSFCTSLRSPKSSHRFTMLRFCRLASHKNNLISSDFSGRKQRVESGKRKTKKLKRTPNDPNASNDPNKPAP